MAATAAKAVATATKASKPAAKAGSAKSSSKATGEAVRQAPFGKAEEMAAYREMLLIRRFEEKAGQMYGMGLIGGFCHLYIGQEAVVVGMQMAARDGDQVITGYRDHGHMLATGMASRGVMASSPAGAAAIRAAKAARCTCSRSRRPSSAATASSARRSRSARAWPSPTPIARTARSA